MKLPAKVATFPSRRNTAVLDYPHEGGSFPRSSCEASLVWRDSMTTSPRRFPDLSHWQPMQLQVIVFPTSSQLVVKQEWWKGLTGEEPASIERKLHQRVERGRFRDCALDLTIDLARVLWSALPHIDLES